MRSHFGHYSVLWGNCNLTRSNKLEKLQNRATRILILMLNTCLVNMGEGNQLEIQKAVMVFKSSNGFTPECLRELFVNSWGTPRTNLLFPHQFFCWHALHAEAPLKRIRVIIIINHHYLMHLISKCFVPDLTKRVFHHLTHNSLWSYAKSIYKITDMVKVLHMI